MNIRDFAAGDYSAIVNIDSSSSATNTLNLSGSLIHAVSSVWVKIVLFYFLLGWCPELFRIRNSRAADLRNARW